MENLKVKLESGAELDVTLASFPEGHRLFIAVTKQMQGFDLSEGTVQNLSMRLLSSEEIVAALWPCMGRATYNGRKCNAALFEDGDIRGDFLEVTKEVLAYNLTPFSKNLGSLSKATFQKGIDILR